MSNKPTLASVLKQLPAYQTDKISAYATHLTIDSNGDVFTWHGEPRIVDNFSLTRKEWLAAADRYLGMVAKPEDASVCIWELKK